MPRPAGSLLQAEPLLDAEFSLAEGPCWDPERALLSWVEIDSGTLWTAAVTAEGRLHAVRAVVELGSRLSFAVPAGDRGWIAGWGTRVVGIGRDGAVTPVCEVTRDRPHMLNDAALDPAGRLWCGSVAPDRAPGGGALFCVHDGVAQLVLEDLDLPNGIAFSPDGELMYVADTLARRILRLPVAEAEAVGDLRCEGMPDGLCVGPAGNLWVAEFRSGRVVRHTPNGEIDQVVRLPDSQVTSCELVTGRLLVMTTGRRAMSESQLRAEPRAGSLFVADVSVQ